MAGFKTGVAVGALLIGAPAVWLIKKLDDMPIMFPLKHVFVNGDYLSVSGSIVGDEPDPKQRPINNMAQMVCHKEQGSCQFLNANQTGGNSVGTIFEETLYVRKWDANEMVADSLDLSSAFNGCMYYEIRVIFKTEDVIYTRLPNPKAEKDRCVEIVGKTKQFRSWRIDNGEAYRRDK